MNTIVNVLDVKIKDEKKLNLNNRLFESLVGINDKRNDGLQIV